MCHSGFHDLGRLQHEWQLHLAGTEELADGLHAGQECLVDDLQRRLLRHGLVEVGLEPVALAVDDATLESLEQRKPIQFCRTGFAGRRRRDALEQLHELLQRIVSVTSTVVDQVERHVALLVGDASHRQDLRRVDDRGVETRLHAFVEEHRVEHLARSGIQAERDVGNTQGEVHLGMSLV